MKTERIKSAILTLFCSAMVVGLGACTTEGFERNAGTLPDKDAIENTYVKFCSSRSATGFAVTNLTEGSTSSSDQIFCNLTRAAEKAMTITAKIDLSLVDPCNAKFNTDLPAMPAANVTIANNGTISVSNGERISDKINISFKSDGLTPGTYLLPVVISSDGATFTEENRVIYFCIKVRGLSLGKYELDTDYLNVFYLNTSTHQPLLADIWIVQKMDGMFPFQTHWERYYGNIVNLRISQLVSDPNSGRAIFKLSADMRYVLDNANKYIRPLQDKGRKVCLTLEGGGTGLGFCNLTDGQIADFVSQVKTVIDEYDLDGVNFFDKNSSYGKESMPAVNTTSYPKLIKAMREALGKDMLITLADYEVPTESFHDTTLTGGIVVGEYIDYAWSGYMSESEDIQILDPWDTINFTPEEAGELGMTLPVNNHPRKPIAGVAPENYGRFAIPWYSRSSEYQSEALGIMNLFVCGMLDIHPNKIVVWADLITNEQTDYEGSWNDISGVFWATIPEVMSGEFMYNVLTEEIMHYDYLKKDW